MPIPAARRARTEVRVHIPELEEVHLLVQRSLREGLPIDGLATATLFPDGAPRRWGEWPELARLAWEGIVTVYTAERPECPAHPKALRPNGGRPSLYPEIGAGQAWDAIDASAAGAPASRLTWPDLARRLGLSRRAAQYQVLGRLGFAFHGQRSQRVLVYAPCLKCGKPRPYAELRERLCVECGA